MDEIINQISEANQNPGLRADLIHDLWNGQIGASYDSPEAIGTALSAGEDAALVAAAREWLGLPIFV